MFIVNTNHGTVRSGWRVDDGLVVALTSCQPARKGDEIPPEATSPAQGSRTERRADIFSFAPPDANMRLFVPVSTCVIWPTLEAQQTLMNDFPVHAMPATAAVPRPMPSRSD